MKAYLLLFCSLCADALYGQDTVFRYSPGGASPLEVITSRILQEPEPGGHLCLVLHTKRDSVVYLLLDQDFHIRSRFVERWSRPSNLMLVERARPLGAPRFEDNVFRQYFVVSPPNLPDRLFEKTIDFGRHMAGEEQRLALPGKQEIMGFFQTAEGRPGVISMAQGDTTLEFHIETADGTDERHDIDVGDIHQADNYFGFIHFVSSEGVQQIDNTAARTLAYIRGRQLVLFTHHAGYPLQLAIVDLNSFQVHYKEFPTPNGSADKQGSFRICSTVFEDKIFQVRAYPDKLEVEVDHIPDLRPLKKFFWTVAAPPVFTALPLAYEVTDTKRTLTPNYPFSQYLEDLALGSLGVAVSKTDSGAYFLTIGDYRDPLNNYTSFGRPEFYVGDGDANTRIPEKRSSADASGFTPFLGIAGSEAMANHHAASLDPGRLHFKASLIKIVLDGKTLDNIAGSNLPWGDTHLADFVKPTDGTGALCAFSIGNRFFTGYYDKKTTAYLIREIPINSR